MQTIPNSNEPFLSYAPSGSLDKSRYLFFGTAGGNPANGSARWHDESGSANDLLGLNVDDVFTPLTDANGKAVLQANDLNGGLYSFPFATLPAGDYTIYAVLRPLTLQAPYLLDASGHSLGLGFNTGDLGAYYFGGVKHGNGALSIAANELAIATWRLSSVDGGRVYKNGALVYAGPYSPAAFNAVAALGHDYSTYYAPFIGDLHALVFRQGNDSDAQVAQVQSYLATLAGLTL